MDTKDWVLLFIPIIFNGILIFSFQTIISHRLKFNEKRKEFVFDIIKKLSDLACEDYNRVSLLIHSCSPGYGSPDQMKPAPFEDLWNAVADVTVQLYDYAQIHRAILEQGGIVLDDFTNAYEQIALVLSRCTNRLLTDEDKQNIFISLKSFEDSIVNLNSRLEKIIAI